MFRQKTALVYTTGIVTLAVILLVAVFLNFLPWTSSAPVEGGTENVAANPEPVLPTDPPGDTAPFEPPLFEGNINRLPLEKIVELLGFLESPIAGAKIQMTNGQLPGAPRTYRNGTHEGIDFYHGFSGTPIYRGIPVLAAAEGIVIRIDHVYTEMTSAERAEYRRISAQAPDTPEDILDKFRGRQVWLEHKDSVITRYAHLDTVNPDLATGDTVRAGQSIGTVGNSGTPPAITGGTGEMHLHFEVWLNGYYLGEGLPPDDVRFILRSIFE